MVKKLCSIILVISILFVGGCKPKAYHIDEQEKKSVSVSENAYMLAGKKLETIDKSDYEEEDVVYYVKNEEELTQVLQYNIDENIIKVAYQSDKEIDLDVVASQLSYLNPFDIALTLSTTDYKDGKNELIYRSYVVEIQNLDDRYEQATAVAERVYKEIITGDMSNDDKIQAIHDYLVRTVIYDEEATYDIDKQTSVFKAAGALIDKVAVCSGYSRAFMMLAKLADVPSIYVASDGMNHGWNLVYGDSGWRFIDVTWDDPVPDRLGHVEYQFLNMSIEEFEAEGSHIFDIEKSDEFYTQLAELIFNKK